MKQAAVISSIVQGEAASGRRSQWVHFFSVSMRLNESLFHRAQPEGFTEAVVAAVHLLPERSVDEVAAKLTGPQLAQVISALSLVSITDGRTRHTFAWSSPPPTRKIL